MRGRWYYAANVYRAWVVQMKSVWRPKKLCQEILKEMAIRPAKNTADMVDQISEEMARGDRPLMIDEADYLIAHNMVEIVRDIYEGCQKWRDKARAFSGYNAQRVLMYRACIRCKVNARKLP